MTTIRDVAIAANVSVATVSRVLNANEAVRPETRSRVLQAIARLNYRPDPNARRLSMGRTFTIGVVLPYLTRPSFIERLRGIEAAVGYTEYDLVVSNVETRAKRDALFQMLATGRRFDGAVIIALPPTEIEVAAWRAAEIPVVLIDCAHPALPSLSIDDALGAHMVADYLISQGHRRIAFLGDVSDHPLGFTSSRRRLAGFQAQLASHGLSLAQEDILYDEHGRREAKVIAQGLLSRPVGARPTAIFAASDVQALGVLDALREAELRAPDDLAVIGFDDIEMAEFYGLTTVRQPLYQSGIEGVEMLWQQLANPAMPPTQQVFPLELIQRQTA